MDKIKNIIFVLQMGIAKRLGESGGIFSNKRQLEEFKKTGLG
jgi:hypothetical protein